MELPRTLATAAAISTGLAALPAACLADAPSRPNILWIVADDAGYHDFGFQGNEAFRRVTPHLDALAQRGTVVERGYVAASVCSPSRAALLTGRYPQRFGFENNLPGSWSHGKNPEWVDHLWREWGLDLAERTIADRLSDAGYATALVGKWHQGLSDAYHPNRRGFDYFFGLLGGSRPYIEIDKPYQGDRPGYGVFWREQALQENGQRQPESGYVTDRLGDAAVGFIESADRDRPFFLFLSFTAPHTPMQADDVRLAWARQALPSLQGKRLTYAAMIKAIDDNVGRVIEALERAGEADETIIVFLSDNGGSKKNAADNTPLRGAKWSPFEGGYRVPMVIVWPGVTEPGERVKQVVSTLDLSPTLLKAAGAMDPAEAASFDGMDIRPWLDNPQTPSRDRVLFWRESNSEGRTRSAMRLPWKLVLSDRHPPRLFNLIDDPAEAEDVAAEFPAQVESLAAELAAWESGLQTPRWKPNDSQ